MITRNGTKDFAFWGGSRRGVCDRPYQKSLARTGLAVNSGTGDYKKRSWLARKAIAESREKGSLCKTITFNKNLYFTVCYHDL